MDSAKLVTFSTTVLGPRTGFFILPSAKSRAMSVAIVSKYLSKNEVMRTIGLYHPLDGINNLKYKLLCFLTPNKKIYTEKLTSF
jgi:hypothetical protein